MKPYVHCDSYIKDSEELVNKLRSRVPCDGDFAVLDVEALFTNVLVPETLEVFERLLRGLHARTRSQDGLFCGRSS